MGKSNTCQFTFISIGDRDEGGLPLATNDRTCFAFHKSAVGCAVAMAALKLTMFRKTSFLVTAKLSMAATAIDTDGIVDVVCEKLEEYLIWRFLWMAGIRLVDRLKGTNSQMFALLQLMRATVRAWATSMM